MVRECPFFADLSVFLYYSVGVVEKVEFWVVDDERNCQQQKSAYEHL